MASSWGSSWSVHWGVSWGTSSPELLFSGRYLKEIKLLHDKKLQSLQHIPERLNNEVQKAAAHMSSLGGLARAKSLSAKQRTVIAAKAANTRWKK